MEKGAVPTTTAPEHRAQPCRCHWRFEKEICRNVQDYQGHCCQAGWGGWDASQCRGLAIVYKLIFKCVKQTITCQHCITAYVCWEVAWQDILRHIIHIFPPSGEDHRHFWGQEGWARQDWLSSFSSLRTAFAFPASWCWWPLYICTALVCS